MTELLPEAHGFTTGPEGLKLHHARRGSGDPVILLHGWPGFWYDWRRVLPLVAPHADAIALDLRGFGESDASALPPDDGANPLVMAGDVVSVMDELGVESAVIAAHDVGAMVAQALALAMPGRVRALVLCNPPYLGIGRRRFEPSAQREMWYQHLHALPWSHELVGRDRETIRTYLGHFYDHWVGRKDSVQPDELETIVDAYSGPGRIESSFAVYRSRMLRTAGEEEVGGGDAAIRVPATVLWGDLDPVLPVEWSDRIPEYFPRSTLRVLAGVGHFVPFEAPDEVAEAILEAVRAP